MRSSTVRWVTIAFIGGIFLLSLWMPVALLQGIPLCYFKFHTGLDCPGCGLTRAFIYLFHGDIRRAVAMNALAPVLALWLTLYLAEHCYYLRKNHRPAWFTREGNRLVSRLFLLLFLAQWVWKNALIVRSWMG
jgi:hypothetical protein